jgi:hypothetical protein
VIAAPAQKMIDRAATANTAVSSVRPSCLDRRNARMRATCLV